MAANEATPIMNNSSTPETQRNNYQSIGQISGDEEIAQSSLERQEGEEERDEQQQQQQINKVPNGNNSNQQNGTGLNHEGTSNIDNNNNNNNNNNNQSNDEVAQQSWYRHMMEKYGPLELDNKGSVARDHLALERTFLAWLRTSLSFASIGIAVTQLFRLNSAISCSTNSTSEATTRENPILSPLSLSSSSSSSSLLEILLAPPSPNLTTNSNNNTIRNLGKPLGATFIGIAILILIIGFHRYFESQYWIVRGKFPASRGSVALISFVAAGLVIASFVVILAIAPNTVEL